MKRLSLRARLTAWYTLALLIVLCLFAADILWQQGRLGLRRVDRELEAFSVTLANVVQEELTEMSDPRLAAQEARDTVNVPGRAIAILDAHGEVLAARWSGLGLPTPLPTADAGPRVWTVETAADAWRVLARPQVFDGASLVLVVASPLSAMYREQREAQEAMLIGIPIVLLLAAGGGIYLASVGLRPITEALRVQRQFTADASHELRTPVSVVRAAADVTLSRDHREEAEYREALAIVSSQSRRMSRLVDDMLVLARADAGAYPLRPVDLYLDEVIAECCRAVDVLAAERGVTIRSSGAPEIPFRGDEDLLRQLVLNVLQNAVQHTPKGGSVAIDIEREAAAVTLRVTDTGAGVPPEDEQRIFDRFVQLDPSRRGQGTGLGLPIARWIAEVHHGTLVLERSGAGGSTFCVSLPV
jgi:two-component system, OmpR family, sensor kinase